MTYLLCAAVASYVTYLVMDRRCDRVTEERDLARRQIGRMLHPSIKPVRMAEDAWDV